MISTILYGRLGNNLFQMAACIGYSVLHKTSYSIPAHTQNDKEWPPHKIGYVKYIETPIRGRLYQEPHYHYKEIPQVQEDFTIEGYFQSYKYFDFCLDELRRLFCIPNKIDSKTVSIHVRRGDYLLYPDKHPVISEWYLKRAVQLIELARGSRNFRVFSDDIEWCKSFFQAAKYSFSEGQNEIDDLYEMSLCSDNIIANSSYSYWAAMLNPNPKKMVVTPHHKNWFGPGNANLDTKDLIPNDWWEIKY